MTTTDTPEHADVVDPDEVTRLRLAVLRLARRLRQEAGDEVTSSQLSALSAIARSGPLTLGELAELERVQPPSITRIVGALEGDGLVERTPHPTDGRVTVVRLTPAGRGLLRRVRNRRDAWLADRLGSLDGRDRDVLAAARPVLERLRVDDGDER